MEYPVLLLYCCRRSACEGDVYTMAGVLLLVVVVLLIHLLRSCFVQQKEPEAGQKPLYVTSFH